MEIELTNTNGITLKTKDKYCSEDIDITPKLQTKTTTVNGKVMPDENYVGLKEITVNVPGKEEEAKEVDLAMASGNQTITPTSGKTLSQVVVKKPATMLPENIKKDVNIGGVTGTFESSGGSELNIAYGNTAPEDTSKLWIKSEEPSNISFPVVWKPEQVVEGIIDTGATLSKSNTYIGTAAVDTKIYLFGGYGNGDSYLNTIQVFDTNNNTIQTLSTTLPQAMFAIGTAAVGTKIYLFGGYGSGSPMTTIRVFDTTNNTIQKLSTTLPQAMYAISTAAVGTKIYLFGGFNSNVNPMTTIQVFDTTNNTIQTLSTTLPQAASYIGTAAVGTKIYLFGGRRSDYLNTIQVFDTNNNTIQTLSTTLPQAMFAIGTAAVGTKIYLFGGYGSGSPMTTIRVFDTTNNTIQKLSTTLPQAMYAISTAAVGTKIYLFGGFNSNVNPMTTIQVFDTTNNTIQTLSTTLPQAMFSMGTAAVDTKIYLFGGDKDGSYLNTIQVFDTTNNTIQTLSTTLPKAADYIGTAAVGTKIYLFGGQTSDNTRLKTIQVFDTTNNTIQTLSTTLSQIADSIGISAVGTKIYLFGGYNGSNKLNTIQVFDTTNNTIQTLSTTLPQAMYAIGTAAVGTKIYLFGGYSKSYINTINLFTVNVPLSSNDIIVTQEYYTRTFKVLKAPTEVEVSCKYVYKGDQNLAKLIDAYLYDGANWVNVNTGDFTFTKLYAPRISISDNTLTITNDGRNGSKVTNYKVYNGSTLLTTITATTLDLTTVITANGTYNISVTATGTGYADSDNSNVVEYIVEAVATGYNVTVSGVGNNNDFDIYDGQSASGTKLGTINSTESINVVCTSGYLYFSTSYGGGIVSVTGGVTQIDSKTVKVTGDGTVTASYYCLIEGTQITLADGTTKAIEDITYDDELLVWNFYAGRFDKAKPSWIKVAEVAPRYNLVKFSNGAEVGFVGAGGEKGYHRIFNKEAGKFTYTGNLKDTPNGTTTFAQDETFPTVVSQEVVEKEVKFYNVITDKHYNLFANGILTSCRLSNKYRIEDMRYIGEKLISDEQEKAYFERIENKRK